MSITGLARRVPYGLGSTIAGLLMDYAEFSLSMILGGIIALLDPVLYYVSLGIMTVGLTKQGNGYENSVHVY